jgi:hypothetical protein
MRWNRKKNLQEKLQTNRTGVKVKRHGVKIESRDYILGVPIATHAIAISETDLSPHYVVAGDVCVYHNAEDVYIDVKSDSAKIQYGRSCRRYTIGKGFYKVSVI